MISITHESSVSWIRDESLTDIIASKFIDLPPGVFVWDVVCFFGIPSNTYILYLAIEFL